MNFLKLQEGINQYVDSLQVRGKPYYFRYTPDCPPTMIASAMAVLNLHLVGILDKKSPQALQEWASFFDQFQASDGIFYDPAERFEECDEDARIFRKYPHRTRHVLFAYTALGRDFPKRLTFIKPFEQKKYLIRWLESQKWEDVWDVGNRVMDLAVLLDYEWQIFRNDKARKSIEMLLDWLDAYQDSSTGYWGVKESGNLLHAMAGAMHLYPFYWIYERSVKYIDKIVDTTLSLQQPDGLFNPVTGIGGSQCLDYDAIHILSNFYWFFPYRQKDITECLKKAGNALLVNHNPDGGFSHNRKEPETFGSGSKETAMKAGQSGLWETYARCLVLAMVSRIVPESSFSGPWHTGSNIMEMVDGLRKPIRSRVFKK